MTQVAAGETVIIGGSTFELQELDCSSDSILAAELAGSLVIAQQVHEDGTPYTINEPGRFRPEVSEKEWELYIQTLRHLRSSGQLLPQRPVPPYTGLVRSLGASASYFEIQRLTTSTTAILPLHTVRPPHEKPLRYRLFNAS